ncbi:ubiquitin-like protein Pup [Arsenicicoccus piscis]|uniref:Prokaryotic ubiquitin-like protein Pup n=1 Tax=Arsenicicoccus piscis TaxID=673954 RepID=A0ABQ6HU39_9MICO|nr:ubiquitin-like protein Pup [Arsenicicoccus piscis]MCH8629303.1 ubiquitin-like protein Pup [Arsenicicoccus piscis]GMA19735.1 prokaryotic ubiquitin-like protein Pup [Arsenicicoccus piscis]GMA22030.1 prokaryotic ubiquitin-like protein Pup [Arsenicicoccus piscis]
MADQEQVRRSTGGDGGGDEPGAVPTAPLAKKVDDAGLDSLLDEIDTVLESNAEEFVKGFVQKGGQ